MLVWKYGIIYEAVSPDFLVKQQCNSREPLKVGFILNLIFSFLKQSLGIIQWWCLLFFFSFQCMIIYTYFVLCGNPKKMEGCKVNNPKKMEGWTGTLSFTVALSSSLLTRVAPYLLSHSHPFPAHLRVLSRTRGLPRLPPLLDSNVKECKWHPFGYQIRGCFACLNISCIMQTY